MKTLHSHIHNCNQFKFKLVLILPLVLTGLVLSANSVYGDDSITLTLLHTNDVHSRFLQTNKHSGSCSEEDVASNKCYGGFSRLHGKVSQVEIEFGGADSDNKLCNLLLRHTLQINCVPKPNNIIFIKSIKLFDSTVSHDEQPSFFRTRVIHQNSKI
jgi:hypothetical protein